MRCARAAAVAALALLLTAAPVASASAAEAVVDVPLLSLWDARSGAMVDHAFIGVPVAVPGDRAHRAVAVRNDGPTGGTLQAWVTQVDLLDPAVGTADGFYDDLRLDWATASQTSGASFRALATAGDTRILETYLPRGAATRVDVSYTLPAATTSGNRARAGDREASFVVRFRIAAETGTPTSSPASPSASPTPAPATAAPTEATGAVAAPGPGRPPTVEVSSASGVGALAVTGLDVLRAALFAVVGIGVGSILLGAVRRRRDVQHPIGSGSTPSAG